VRFASLSSGSAGNAWLFQANGHSILVDCGLTYRELRRRFDIFGADPFDVQAILLTHAHGDHHNALRRFATKHGVPIYCTQGTLDGIPWLAARPHMADVIEMRQRFSVAGFDIVALPVVHDSVGAVTFAVMFDDFKVMMILETGKITAEIAREAADAQVIVIEANHEPYLVAESVEDGLIPQSTAVSILTRHLSNEAAANFLAGAKLMALLAVLAHLSRDRNNPDLAASTVLRKLKEAGRVMDVVCAAQDEPSPWFDLVGMTNCQIRR
jgi:phosphoribosyl 1,2-cyclic phosphodiesterase